MLYTMAEAPAQTVADPVMVPAAFGSGLTVIAIWVGAETLQPDGLV